MEIACRAGVSRGGNFFGDPNEINAMPAIAKSANRAKLGQCDNRQQMRLPSRRYAHEVRAAQSSKSDHGDDKFPTEQLTASVRRNDVNACVKIADLKRQQPRRVCYASMCVLRRVRPAANGVRAWGGLRRLLEPFQVACVVAAAVPAAGFSISPRPRAIAICCSIASDFTRRPRTATSVRWGGGRRSQRHAHRPADRGRRTYPVSDQTSAVLRPASVLR